MAGRFATFELGHTRFAVVSVPVASAGSLTKAEAEVAALIARGLSNAEIAEQRGTSARTVANQVRGLLRKLGARNRREIAAALVREG